MDQPRNVPTGASRPSNATVDALLGRMIGGRYRVLSVLARGGIGAIYRAEQLPLGRQVALKVVEADAAETRDPAFEANFAREVADASRLKHPNTVSIFEYGKSDGLYFIAMELLEGRTLYRELREYGALPASRAVQIACQVSRSVREAHSVGLVHGDLTSANVFLLQHGDECDVVKVLDVGVMHRLERKHGAGTGEAAHLLGSPRYMAPEQICGEVIDARADIYALGVMLFEMLTGRVPFERANAVNVLMAHIHDAAPSLVSAAPQREFGVDLEALVRRCLAKSKDARFRDMDELLGALKRCALSVRDEGAYVGTGDGRLATLAPTPHPGVPTRSSSSAQLTPSEQLTLSPARTSEPPARRQKRWAAMLAIVALSTAAGGLIALAARSGAHGVVVSALRDHVAVGAAMPPPMLPAPRATAVAPRPLVAPSWVQSNALDAAQIDAPAEVSVTLTSTPPGAMVRVGGQLFGPTPTTVHWTGASAEAGREVTFRFEYPGLQPLDVTRQIRGSELAIDASPSTPLEPATHRGRRGPRRNPAAEPSATAAPEAATDAQEERGFLPSPY